VQHRLRLGWFSNALSGLAPTGGALLSSDDYGSSVERTATLHPVWQGEVRR
jgi:hypothetical protein